MEPVSSISRLAKAALVVAFGCAAMAGTGCQAIGFFGGMAQAYHETGKTTYAPKYDGLEGKSFAVVVTADRSIQSDNPEIVPLMTRELTRRLTDNCGAAGVVPADDVLLYQYQHPGWLAKTPFDLAKELDVQRLVYIELQDFATTDQGNPYLWNGNAAAVVQVLEPDGETPDVFVYRETVQVKFPDTEGLSQMQIPGDTVRLELSRRVISRVAWLFFEHEEPNNLKY